MQDVLGDCWFRHAEDPAKGPKTNTLTVSACILPRLKGHCGDAPLCNDPTLPRSVSMGFSKAKKRASRPDSDKTSQLTRKWRQNCAWPSRLRQVARPRRPACARARKEGWADLMRRRPGEAYQKTAGHYAAAVTTRFFTSRYWPARAGIELGPGNGGHSSTGSKPGFVTLQTCRCRNAQNFLNTYRLLPRNAALLPEVPCRYFRPPTDSIKRCGSHRRLCNGISSRMPAGGVDEVMGGDQRKK